MTSGSRDTQTQRGILARSSWFARLPRGLQVALIQRSSLKRFERGAVFSRQDQPAKGLFAILEGQVAVTRDAGGTAPYFYILGGPSLWFGEIAVLSGVPTVVNLTARSDVTLLFLSVGHFRKLQAEFPDVYKQFADLAVRRAALLTRSLAAAGTLNPRIVLRLRLTDIASQLRSKERPNAPVLLEISQSEIAQMIGSSRQSVNALLAELAQEGLVEVGFRKLTILNPEKLEGTLSSSGYSI